MSAWPLLSQPAPEPPIPSPVTPTVVVEPQLNLPPEILERLPVAPATGWLTQPVATLIAAGMTVVAALVAFAGVLFIQYMTRRNLTAQLDKQEELHKDAQKAQAIQHEKSIKSQLDLLRMQVFAADQKQQREDRLNALSDSQAALAAANSAAIDLILERMAEPRGSHRETRDKLKIALDTCEIRILKLELLQLEQSSKALGATRRLLVDVYANQAPDLDLLKEVTESYKAAVEAFKFDATVTP
ncbi:hypothetical protein JWS13_10005 [Rhodococcus pseudokoreensis]|uniref:Uncharacterized protein n=1 Tax=Rhodococcus pseudokoreensis TaxID=2811421 RepID=A0A974ZSL8_9NOCA|nr:hypothetical protein [Rhodococcus pseudokoreensis]QSE88915.1 hypothetical protein JWS13_10005 [Rhodococcus pseudokoreensis]